MNFETLLVCTSGVNNCKLRTRKSGRKNSFKKYEKNKDFRKWWIREVGDFKIIMFIASCIIVIAEEYKTNLMSLAILFHFLFAQHVSDINLSIIRSFRLCCWITTSVVLFSVCCVLEIWCGWIWVVSVLQAPDDGHINVRNMLST